MIERWVVERLPDAEKGECVSVAEPVLDNVAWIFIIAVSGNVCQREVVVVVAGKLCMDVDAFCLDDSGYFDHDFNLLFKPVEFDGF